MLLATYGALAMGHLLIAAIFLRFWSKVHAALLMIFSVSFALLSMSYVALCFVNLGDREPTVVYLVRLVAFSLIAGGIVWTNLRTRQERQ
jgi:predicted tellurium resistance membrane protein TerC